VLNEDEFIDSLIEKLRGHVVYSSGSSADKTILRYQIQILDLQTQKEFLFTKADYICKGVHIPSLETTMFAKVIN
jgi:hypothetical protein